MVEYCTVTISCVWEGTLLIVSLFCSVSEMGFYVSPYTVFNKTEEVSASSVLLVINLPSFAFISNFKWR